MNAGSKRYRKIIIAAGAQLIAVHGTNSALAEVTGAPGDVRRDRYLLLDSRIVASTTNAVLGLGSPWKDLQNPQFCETWESRFDNPYAKVIHDHEDTSLSGLALACALCAGSLCSFPAFAGNVGKRFPSHLMTIELPPGSHLPQKPSVLR